MKNENKLSYYPFLLGITVLAGIAALGIQQYEKNWIHSYFWIIQGFFIAISIATHLMSQYGLKNRKDFHLYYLVSMAIRFIPALFFLLFSVFLLKENRIAYVADFFVLYILYTTFEIYYLMRNLRADSEKDGSYNS